MLRTAIVTLLVIVIVYWWKLKTDDMLNVSSNLYKSGIPIIDCNYVGDYGNKLKTSLSYWIYALLVHVYHDHDKASIYDRLVQWYTEDCYDPDLLISNIVEDSYTRFLLDIDEALEEKHSPVFKCDLDYDYHNLPKTLQYNDYVDCDKLIEYIDSL